MVHVDCIHLYGSSLHAHLPSPGIADCIRMSLIKVHCMCSIPTCSQKPVSTLYSTCMSLTLLEGEASMNV